MIPGNIKESIIKMNKELSDVYTSLLNNSMDKEIAKRIMIYAKRICDLAILHLEYGAHDRENS